MQFKAQEFLPIVEESHKLLTFDIEATNLRGDYGSILCASFRPYGKDVITVSVDQPGDDKKVVREIKEIMSAYPCWVSYYGKGFDVPMIQTRLLVNGYKQLEKKHHIDLYYVLKYKLLTARRSQAHLLRLLETQQQKLDVSANAWNQVMHSAKAMDLMRERCESDTEGLQALYDKTRHLIEEITK